MTIFATLRTATKGRQGSNLETEVDRAAKGIVWNCPGFSPELLNKVLGALQQRGYKDAAFLDTREGQWGFYQSCSQPNLPDNAVAIYRRHLHPYGAGFLFMTEEGLQPDIREMMLNSRLLTIGLLERKAEMVARIPQPELALLLAILAYNAGPTIAQGLAGGLIGFAAGLGTAAAANELIFRYENACAKRAQQKERLLTVSQLLNPQNYVYGAEAEEQL